MTRRQTVRWRRLVNRACKAYRRNVAYRASLKRRMHAAVAAGDVSALAWASVWGAFPGSEYCTV